MEVFIMTDLNETLFWTLYLVFYFVAMVYGAYAYIGMSLGGHRMGRKVGMSNPWMFWIPCANVYALGNLADTQASLCEGKNTTYRKKMLAWTIVVACISIVWAIAFSVYMVVAAANGMLDANGDLVTLDGFDPDALIGPALFFLLTSLAFLVLYIVYLVIYYKALYRIYKLYAPDGAAGLLILSIFVNVAIPAVFLSLSKREPVLPPRGEDDGDGEAYLYTL